MFPNVNATNTMRTRLIRNAFLGERYIRATMTTRFVRPSFMPGTATNRKERVCFVCADMRLSPETILRIYTMRRAIETYFKMAKSCLKLRDECHKGDCLWCSSTDTLTPFKPFSSNLLILRLHLCYHCCSRTLYQKSLRLLLQSCAGGRRWIHFFSRWYLH